MSASSHATETDGKQDSYLKRYYRTLPEEKRLMIEKSLMNAADGQEPVRGSQDPDKKGKEHKNKAKAEDPEGNDPKEPSSKKSSTCIVL